MFSKLHKLFSRGPRRSDGWLVTVYYTPVEEFCGGDLATVTGNVSLTEDGGGAHLGDYPSQFVERVMQEGTGRITSGDQAGRYLNWSHNIGYWLDEAPRDAHGRPLRPFCSAAADPDVLRKGTRFRISSPGRRDNGEPPPPRVAELLASTTWEIRDEFTPGYGSDKHLDLYIGEQTHSAFESSDMYVTIEGVQIVLPNSC
ncbi:hypothetical protein [Amycolatopsis sp. A1MSW2902]|uniref:hypothetical protein n=1 Tax=Amycolatopsis sp. A1MSW2902 TaxID=687413 RepID=UPI00307F031B